MIQPLGAPDVAEVACELCILLSKSNSVFPDLAFFLNINIFIVLISETMGSGLQADLLNVYI